MVIDWTITIGNLIQILVITGGGVMVFINLRTDIKILKNDVNRLGEAFSKLGAVLTQIAVQDARIQMMQNELNELRHGQGFVVGK